MLNKILQIISNLSFVQSEIKSKSAQKIIKLYSNAGFIKEFVKIRFWFGPLNDINALVPKKGKIVDLGCGEGILANFLAVNYASREVVGVELSGNRVKEATRGIKNTKFYKGNILTFPIPKAKVVILSHVLHHLSGYKAQEKVLDRCQKLLDKNGKLIIAEVNKGFNLAYLFGWLVDILVVPVLFEKQLINLNVYHRNFLTWINLLNERGFKIEKLQFTLKRIYPEVIIVATRN